MEVKASKTRDLLSLPVNTLTRLVSPRTKSRRRRDPRTKAKRATRP